MNRYAIQDRILCQWEGTHDHNNIESALEASRCGLCADAVNESYRWLTYDLSQLYWNRPREAAACYTWIKGFMSGIEFMNKKLEVPA